MNQLRMVDSFSRSTNWSQGPSAWSSDFNWQSQWRTQPDSASQQTHGGWDIADIGKRANDRTQLREQGSVLEVRYGDPNMDRKLASGHYTTLKIDDVPQGVKLSPWMDNNGFFFWYQNGFDNRAHHHLPPTLHTIEVNGFSQNVDEMRLQASQAFLASENNGNSFANLQGGGNIMSYAMGISGGATAQALGVMEKSLAEAADKSPTNPYLRLYLSDIMLAQAVKSGITQVENGQRFVNMDTPYTRALLNQALVEAQQAQQIAQKYGENIQITGPMGLSPFGLNPYSYNPGYYWGGAQYQAAQREALLQFAINYLPYMNNLELP